MRNERGAGLLIGGRGASSPLPDPLPPAQRLDRDVAARLVGQAAREGSSWQVLLARRMGGGPERVAAAADYYRAIGLQGLLRGLHAVKSDLISRVLRSSAISIYGGGRSDVAFGRVDVRVLVAMLYLAERRGAISVTSLMSGHGYFTKSGHVSLHSSGRAVDIGSVAGVPIAGNQGAGGIIERALRDILLLPAELRPSELISLFALGGPSFAMADHADHIHIGY